jgi:hypothetical protein
MRHAVRVMRACAQVHSTDELRMSLVKQNEDEAMRRERELQGIANQ